MTMNPFEQSTQQLLRFLTSHAEWEVIDYIRQEIQHDAPDSVPTAEELLTFFRSPDAPTELDTYQQNTIPRIGSIKLTKLTAHDLQKLYKDLMENGRIDRKSGHGNPGLSSTTVRSLHLMLHSALERAV